VMTCRQGSFGRYAEVVRTCMPGGCSMDPRTGSYGCRVPEYTCPAGVTGYQCLGDRRIDCAADRVAWDRGDCTEVASPGTSKMHCVANPGGEMLPCGFTTEPCATPGEVRCMGNGTVVCRDSVWTAYVPSAAVGQAACDANKIRYSGCGQRSWPQAHTWCEGDQIFQCDDCVDYYDDARTWGEYLCVSFTPIAECRPGTCFSHVDNAFLMTVIGCQEAASECSASGQIVCRGDRPGYCSGSGTAVLGKPCYENGSMTAECQLISQFDHANCK
jgi:hypothetical protein